MIENKKVRRGYSQKRRQFGQVVKRIEGFIFDEVREGRLKVVDRFKVFYYLIQTQEYEETVLKMIFEENLEKFGHEIEI